MPAPLSDSALEAKRDRILDAARRVCRRSDLDAAKMADIAAEAKVSKGTLYRFFQSKEDLLLEMICQSLTEATAAMERAISAAPGGRGLQAFVDLVAETVPTALETNRLVFQALGFASRDEATGRRLFEMHRDAHAQRGSMLQQVLTDAQARGDVPGHVDAAFAATSLLALVDGYAWRCNLDEQMREPARLKTAFHAIIGEWMPSSSSDLETSAA